MSAGPLPAALGPLLRPLAFAYGRAVARRNARFDAGRGVVRAARPVISIGNVVAGGTGKSPFVRWTCGALAALGVRPAIALRGYGAARGEASDEALEHGEALPDVPRIVGPDRAAAIARFLAAGGAADAIVLDDGFQHRRLHRDLDLVLVDATRPGLDGALLPAGWLREPAEALRRADAVVITRAAAIDPALAALVERHHGAPPIAWTAHAWRSLRVVERGATRRAAVDHLAGRSVVALFGTGNPAAIRAQAEAAGARIVRAIPVPDHATYAPRRVRALAEQVRGAEALLTTPKDWVKLSRRIDWSSFPVPVIVPELEIAFHAGEPVLRARLAEAVRLGASA